jgi:hypothetical protein
LLTLRIQTLEEGLKEGQEEEGCYLPARGGRGRRRRRQRDGERGGEAEEAKEGEDNNDNVPLIWR